MFTALVAIDFMKPAGLSTPDAFENVVRWHREVSARPSAGAGLKISPLGCFECYVTFGRQVGLIDLASGRPCGQATPVRNRDSTTAENKY